MALPDISAAMALPKDLKTSHFLHNNLTERLTHGLQSHPRGKLADELLHIGKLKAGDVLQEGRQAEHSVSHQIPTKPVYMITT